MPLPYSAATSGAAALADLEKILNRFGCQAFGTMTDNEAGELIVQFKHRDRQVSIRASFRGYAQAWLKEHPFNPSRMRRKTRQQHEAAALEQARISVCSIVRDWIKGQVTAIEVGMLSFEGAFLGQILLPDGTTFLDRLVDSDGTLKIDQK